MQCQAQSWTLPLPSSLQDLLENHPWHGPPQDSARQGRSQEAADIRGSSTTLRQEEEDGDPLSSEGSQTEGRQKILFPGQTGTRGETCRY